jgi:hypothetical protein
MLTTIRTIAGGVGALVNTAGGSLATLDTVGLVIRGAVPSGQRSQIAVGQAVTVQDEVNGRTGQGSVASLGALTNGADTADGGTSAQGLVSPSAEPAGAGGAGAPPGSASGSRPSGYAIVITPESGIDASWLGSDVVLTVATGATPSPVLAVPVAAITQSPQGSASVTVRRPDGSQIVVPVTTGTTAGGMAAVTPVAPATLQAGDVVVTGQ